MAELNFGNFSKNLQWKTDEQTDRKNTQSERAFALPKNDSNQSSIMNQQINWLIIIVNNL